MLTSYAHIIIESGLQIAYDIHHTAFYYHYYNLEFLCQNRQASRKTCNAKFQ